MTAFRDEADACPYCGALTQREFADVLLIGFGARWERVKMDFGLAAEGHGSRRELRRIEALADDFSQLCNPRVFFTEVRGEIFPLARNFLWRYRDLLRLR